MIEVLVILVVLWIAFYVGNKVGKKDATKQWKDNPTQGYIDEQEKRIGTQLLEELVTNGDTKELATQMLKMYVKGRTLPFSGGMTVTKDAKGKNRLAVAEEILLDSTPEYESTYPNDSLIHAIVNDERYGKGVDSSTVNADANTSKAWSKTINGKYYVLSDDEYQWLRIREGLLPVEWKHGGSIVQQDEDIEAYEANVLANYDERIENLRERLRKYNWSHQAKAGLHNDIAKIQAERSAWLNLYRAQVADIKLKREENRIEQERKRVEERLEWAKKNG
jgi:hypothetical protein